MQFESAHKFTHQFTSMKKQLLFLLTLFFGLYGCKKKDATVFPAATPDTASAATTLAVIKGIISPADAVTNVLVYDANNIQHNVKPDANGVFTVTGLHAGRYFISYGVTMAYVPQSSGTLDLVAGQTLDLGKLAFVQGAGMIEGSTAPAGAAAKVTATNTSTKASYSVVPDGSTGKYKISDLPGGVYTISYTASGSSVAPPDKRATVGANQDISLPLIIFKTPGVTATFSGTLDPPKASSVYFYSRDYTYSAPVTLDTVSGKFVSPDLLPGTYTVGFGHDWTHKSPPTQTITIAPGHNFDMGTIKVPLYLYLIPYSAGGVSSVVGASGEFCSYNAPKLTISAENASAIPEDESREVLLHIALDNVTGPGTYMLQGTLTSYMDYISGNPYHPSKWGMANGGTATVIITSIDPVQRVITGSFSATLKPVSNATDDMIITNGIIKLTY